MNYVLRIQDKFDRLIHRKHQTRTYDIVPGSDVVFRIQSEIVADARIDLVDMYRTELAIASGIAEVIRKLLPHDLSFNSVCTGSRREHASPRATAKRSCAEQLK